MMGYVGRLAARSLNKAEVVKPRNASIFEPQSAEVGVISMLGVVDEVGGDAPMPKAKEEKSSISHARSFLRRRPRSPQDVLLEPNDDESESQKISPERSYSPPSADSSLKEEPEELSTRTLRSHSIFHKEVQPATSPEGMSNGYLSGDDGEPARESRASALEEKSKESSIRTLRPHSILKQEAQPLTSPEEMKDEFLSVDNSSWGPVRENHKGARMSVQEVVPEVVPQVETGSAIEETAQSRHVLRPFVSKLPVHVEHNELIIPNVVPRRRKISAMLRTTVTQSSKDDPLGQQAFAHRSSSSESDPVIHVTIGRIEVKANQRPPIQEKRNDVRNILSLEEYLKRPRGRG
jgi:hypothetical protein